MSESKIVWEKQIENYILTEFVREPGSLPCSVYYADPDGDDVELSFGFGSWGIDREQITKEQIWAVCQGLLSDDANVSVSSFYANFEYYTRGSC